MARHAMIEAKGLTKRFGAVRALDKVSFEVDKGEVVGFLGPNGAGKSTTMRILTCYISATGGSAKVDGHDVFEEPLAVRQSIGYLPQRAQMYNEMSVWDYLSFVGELRKLDRSVFKKRMSSVVEVCGLAGVLGRDIGTLSHGFRQRVGLGQALIHDPKILILDEPTSDLDPNEKAEVIEYIQEIGRDRTVVLSTHNLAEVEAACARAIIISRGRVVADGNIEDVRARGGRVRYQIVISEKEGLRNGAPTIEEVETTLGAIQGALEVKELPTDDTAHAYSLLAGKDSDLRAEIFRLCVDKGWLLLEMRREIQKLEDVFKSLTKGDELLSRGKTAEAAALAEEEADEDNDDEDEDEEEDGDGDDEDEGAKVSSRKEGKEAKADDDADDDDEDADDDENAHDDEDDAEEDDEDEDKAVDTDEAKGPKDKNDEPDDDDADDDEEDDGDEEDGEEDDEDEDDDDEDDEDEDEKEDKE